METAEFVANIKDWVAEVGELQSRKLKQEVEVNDKSAAIDLVTEVDEASEAILIDRIRQTYPQHSILAEERGELNSGSDYLWIIDPLDGTTNYVQGFIIYSISVAVEYKGEVIAGVVYIPEIDHLYTAQRGKGAYLNGELLSVSDCNKLEDAVLVTGFPYDRATSQRNNVDNFSKLVVESRGIRRTGSAAFDLCNLAAGTFDGYWELKLSPWDLAAGQLLVEEAGGQVTTFSQGKELSIVAGNPVIYDQLRAEVEGLKD